MYSTLKMKRSTNRNIMFVTRICQSPLSDTHAAERDNFYYFEGHPPERYEAGARPRCTEMSSGQSSRQIMTYVTNASKLRETKEHVI